MSARYTTVDEVLDDVWGTVGFSSFEQRPALASVDIFGSQPLHTAVTWGDAIAVTLLLDAGAAIDARHEDGETALHHAIRMGHFGVARLLISRGADQAVRDGEGKLARDYCSSIEWPGLGLNHGI
jgi:ankyrin repeat protein